MPEVELLPVQDSRWRELTGVHTWVTYEYNTYVGLRSYIEVPQDGVSEFAVSSLLIRARGQPNRHVKLPSLWHRLKVLLGMDTEWLSEVEKVV